MWSGFLTNKVTTIYNSLFVKSEKNSIVDPFSCMVRLAVLNFKPTGTKISFNNNRLSYCDPNILQGPLRWSQGDNREDLHNLFQPIKKAMEWYDYNDEKIKIIFKLSERGIYKLESSYTYNSLITHSLELYRNYINKYYKLKIPSKTDPENGIESKIFIELKELWSENEINIIYNILLEMKTSNKNTLLALINAIDSILTHKEDKVREIIIQNTTILE